MAEIWLSVKAAARELGIAERTCRKYLEEGKLEGRKVLKGNREVWRVFPEACRKIRPDIQGPETAVPSAQSEAQAVLEELRSLRQENAEYRQVIELQAQATERLAARIAALEDMIQKALPPAVEESDPEVKLTWWRRLFKGKEG